MRGAAVPVHGSAFPLLPAAAAFVVLCAGFAIGADPLAARQQSASGATIRTSGSSEELPPESDVRATARIGDRIRVQVWRQPEFSGDFYVTENGAIGHPLYRSIVAAERSPDNIRRSLLLFLSEFETEPNFVVEVFFQVAVGGEVRQPNIHHLRPGTTVAEAVALSGGISDRGALDRVILRRDGMQYRGDLTDPASEFRRIPIRSGDEIVVERRLDLFRDYIVPVLSVAGSIASIIRLASPR